MVKYQTSPKFAETGETGAARRARRVETGAAGRGLLAYQSLAAGEAIHSSTKSA